MGRYRNQPRQSNREAEDTSLDFLMVDNLSGLALFDMTTKANGESFIELFYAVCDGSREVSLFRASCEDIDWQHVFIYPVFILFSFQNVTSFFLDTSEVVWDGNKCESLAHVKQFFTELPVTHHTVLESSTHAINPQSDGPGISYMVMATGHLAYGVRAMDCGFTHTFTLCPHPTNSARYYIASFICNTKDESIVVNKR